MKNFWKYKIINPVISGDKKSRNKRVKLILKAFGGKNATKKRS
jgi:hypothetical protein